MSSRGKTGAGRGSRGSPAKRGGNRYFAGKAADAAPKDESKKIVPVAAPAPPAGKKGQKRKGGPDTTPKQSEQKVVTPQPQKKKGKRPRAERNGRKPWEIEEKVVAKEPEVVSKDEDEEEDDSADSEASLPSDSEDSDFEEVVAKQGGSARYKAALALRATFENFRQPGAEEESEDDEDDGEEEIQSKPSEKKETKRLEGDFISLAGDEDDDDVEIESHFDADADLDSDDEDDKKAKEGEEEVKEKAREEVEGKVEEKEEEEEEDSTTKKANKQKGKRSRGRFDKSKLVGTGAVYLGHIPHGFYKEEMQGFFAQFGRVLMIAHPRSKKTGRSKGYAFILFRHKEVAEVVAETMNGYLIFGRILRCKYIPASEIPRRMFKNANREYPWVKTPEEHGKVVQALVAKENKKRQMLKELGIDYDFPGYAAVAPPKAKKARTQSEKSEEKPSEGEAKQEQAEKKPSEEGTKKEEAATKGKEQTTKKNGRKPRKARKATPTKKTTKAKQQ